MASAHDIAGVIVADDDSMIRGILRSKLADIGQAVFLASDGEEAIALAARIQAALVILDINMPRLDGLIACRRIRALPGYAATPIVILTTNDDAQARVAALKAGATAFINKPFRPAPLMQVLSRFLPIDRTTRQSIQRSVGRTNDIANPPRNLTPEMAKSASGQAPNALDRGRNILAVLRG